MFTSISNNVQPVQCGETDDEEDEANQEEGKRCIPGIGDTGHCSGCTLVYIRPDVTVHK